MTPGDLMSTAASQTPEHWDVVVSGFGGSVTALRLPEQG
jgi:hypothetical protein